MPTHNTVRQVVSNQKEIVSDLEKTVLKYFQTTYQRPYATHTIEAFKQAVHFTQAFTQPVILDSGCGCGESSFVLAAKYPNHPVIGIDKSICRLSKTQNKNQPTNLLFLQAELLDFWRLAYAEKLDVFFHALYYPNPWPKESQVGRRFHAHPIFPTLLQLCSNIELRTNWKIYAEEFLEASRVGFQYLQMNFTPFLEEWIPKQPETAFERKYYESGQTLYRVKTMKE